MQQILVRDSAQWAEFQLTGFSAVEKVLQLVLSILLVAVAAQSPNQEVTSYIITNYLQ